MEEEEGEGKGKRVESEYEGGFVLDMRSRVGKGRLVIGWKRVGR